MCDFGVLKKVPQRDIQRHEATNFTPWLAENIKALGGAHELELELTEREASVGYFSLNLLSTDLGSSKTVLIEIPVNSNGPRPSWQAPYTCFRIPCVNSCLVIGGRPR